MNPSRSKLNYFWGFEFYFMSVFLKILSDSVKGAYYGATFLLQKQNETVQFFKNEWICEIIRIYTSQTLCLLWEKLAHNLNCVTP